MKVCDYRLCYVCPRNGFAYFTSIPLSKQWGDDWDDAPYEHNAGDPYDTHCPKKGAAERVAHDLVKVAWDADYITPNESHVNSPWSVQAINSGAIAWLIPNRWDKLGDECDIRPIHAGVTLIEFVRTVEASGGVVYIPRQLAEEITDGLTNDVA